MNPFLRDCLIILEGICWPICFWWMHLISKRQHAVLEQLRKQAQRIENVSKEEHEILKEVHPAVQKIEESVADQASPPDRSMTQPQRTQKAQPAS